MHGELHGKDLRKNSLADNSVGTRMSGISKELCNKLNDKLETSHFAL
jgi:hypothetical protein